MAESASHNTDGDLRERAVELAGLVRVEKQLKARTKEVSNQIREAYKKAASAGHDVVALKQAIREALLPAVERLAFYELEEAADMLIYSMRKALGLMDEESDDPLGADDAAREVAEEHADLLAGNDIHDDSPVMDRGKGKRS